MIIGETTRKAKQLLSVRQVGAAVVCLFLSCALVGATVTLPIHPRLGVKTKFDKSATTSLLDIPELMEVVAAWDHRVRPKLPAEAMWYANVIGARARHVEAAWNTDAGDAWAHAGDACTPSTAT